MTQKPFTALIAVFLLTGITSGLLATVPVRAAPQSQAVLPTPTAQSDGRIIYIAQPGDSWWIISAKMGIPEQQLYQLNSTSPEDVIQAGQQILLGTVAPTPEGPPQSQSTPTPSGPTATPFKGTGNVCIVLFVDTNGNAVREESEMLLPTGAVSMIDRSGTVNLTGQTQAGETPLCFNDVAEGEYNISVAVPEGFNPTTNMNYALKLFAGENNIIPFGAQPSGAAGPAPDVGSGGRNPLVALIGGILILGGIGLGVYYVLRMRR